MGLQTTNIAFQWLPAFDKQRYKPLGIHPGFLQNIFDVVFLLAFVWYWNWGPILVLLYYIVETIVMWSFTAVKLCRNKAEIERSSDLSANQSKWIVIATLSVVVLFFSYVQISIAHEVLSKVMTLPSLSDIVFSDKDFLIGIAAIVVQQTFDYIKYQQAQRNEAFEFVSNILTPMLRIFIQQMSVIFGVIAVLVVSFIDAQLATIMIALILGLIKLFTGQLEMIPKQ